jgi:FOG: PKD repeat
MIVDFIPQIEGLKVTFVNISIPLTQEDKSIEWDFGDGTISIEVNPTHTYEKLGKYVVKLRYINNTSHSEVGSSTKFIMVSDKVQTVLSDTIYNLIDNYLPNDIFADFNTAIKQYYIQKWQLYLYPLVNHKIDVSNYSNELYYEALENTLIMEVAAYDFIVARSNQIIQEAGNLVGQSNGSESSQGSGGIKQIQTGPTEVQYFDENASATDRLSQVIKALKPDGVISLLKDDICMLAERLEIYLPICRRGPVSRVVPRVVNRREGTFLGGPDPHEILKLS